MRSSMMAFWQLLQKLSRLVRATNQRLVLEPSPTDKTIGQSGQERDGLYGDTILEGDE